MPTPPFPSFPCTLPYQVVKKFPDSRYTSVGGWLFLRFFCPAITAPESFGIMKEPPPPEVACGHVPFASTLTWNMTGFYAVPSFTLYDTLLPCLQVRRFLVLIAKALQNISNNTQFKEPHMESLNVFITGNIDALNNFLDKMVRP
jgi:neurofibromin 1